MAQVAIAAAVRIRGSVNAYCKRGREHSDSEGESAGIGSEPESLPDEDPLWRPCDSNNFKKSTGQPKKKRRAKELLSNGHQTTDDSTGSVCASRMHTGPAPAARARDRGDFQVNLSNRELWDKFMTVGTEMIICKGGRSVN